jgi:hypothetical protein
VIVFAVAEPSSVKSVRSSFVGRLDGKTVLVVAEPNTVNFVGSKEAVAALREKVVWLDFLTGTTLVIPGQIRDEVDWRKTDVSTIPCG